VKKILLILLILSLNSCSILHRVPQKEYIHDTTTVYQNNTTYLHDSIYVWRDHTIYEKGDTVYDKVIEYKDRWRIRDVHDTLYKDRIKYEYKEVPVEVEKPLTGIQKTLITFGKVFILALLALLGYFGVKKFILKM
jgi:hypothetical protein